MTLPQQCFVIMPYGRKKDLGGKTVDFDAIYQNIITPAVDAVPGLSCIRCDDDDMPGWIPARMLRFILESRVAVVDTSTWNANVFYELGVRHTLAKSVTVLIRRKGTPEPFNIQGLKAVEYETAPKAKQASIERITNSIKSALADATNVDSLVYEVFRKLKPPYLDEPETKIQEIPFPLPNGKSLALCTGDRADMQFGDIWVNSENTDMQMDVYYGKSTSATIRYLGAQKDSAGRVIEDTIGDELLRIAGPGSVPPAAVLQTGPGMLTSNNVQRIFHVATVRGEPRRGYKPVEQLDRCVKNALLAAKGTAFQSILFPIFGTGPGGGDLETNARICFGAAAEFLMDLTQVSPIKAVYFYVWTARDLDICRAVMQQTVAAA